MLLITFLGLMADGIYGVSWGGREGVMEYAIGVRGGESLKGRCDTREESWEERERGRG